MKQPSWQRKNLLQQSGKSKRNVSCAKKYNKKNKFSFKWNVDRICLIVIIQVFGWPPEFGPSCRGRSSMHVKCALPKPQVNHKRGWGPISLSLSTLFMMSIQRKMIFIRRLFMIWLKDVSKGKWILLFREFGWFKILFETWKLTFLWNTFFAEIEFSKYLRKLFAVSFCARFHYKIS